MKKPCRLFGDSLMPLLHEAGKGGVKKFSEAVTGISPGILHFTYKTFGSHSNSLFLIVSFKIY
jgi:hypothetical protein